MSRSSRRRIGSAEFRNTHFSYTMGENGVERFVPTPELQSEDAIGVDPLPRWPSLGHQPWRDLKIYAGLYRVEVNVGPGSGVKIIKHPTSWSIPGERQVCRRETSPPAPRTWSATGTLARMNSQFNSALSTPRGMERSSVSPTLLALCSALLGKSLKGGLATVGGLNLWGRVGPGA